MTDWVIYYTDGRRITSDDCAVTEVPARGVQVVLVYDQRAGRRVLKLADYYAWSPKLDRWIDCLDAASVIVRATIEPWIKIIAGEYLNEPDFERILIAAHNDLDLPPRSPESAAHPAWRE